MFGNLARGRLIQVTPPPMAPRLATPRTPPPIAPQFSQCPKTYWWRDITFKVKEQSVLQDERGCNCFAMLNTAKQTHLIFFHLKMHQTKQRRNAWLPSLSQSRQWYQSPTSSGATKQGSEPHVYLILDLCKEKSRSNGISNQIKSNQTHVL